MRLNPVIRITHVMRTRRKGPRPADTIRNDTILITIRDQTLPESDGPVSLHYSPKQKERSLLNRLTKWKF